MLNSLLRKRRKSDRGDALLTMSLIFVGLFAITAGFAIDISKSVYVKSSFQVMAQQATSDAARYVDARGSLTEQAASFVPQFYNNQFDGEAGGFARAGASSGRCAKVIVDDVEYKAPYMEIVLSQRRGVPGEAVSYKWDPDGGFRAYAGSYNPVYNYHVVTAKIWDTSPNLMMGIFGLHCQRTYTEVSSITFGSQSDVDGFYGG